MSYDPRRDPDYRALPAWLRPFVRVTPYLWWLAGTSRAFRVFVFRPLTHAFVAVACGVKATGVTLLWNRWLRPTARAAGRIRAGYLARKLGLDPARADDLARLQDFEDACFGVEGTWETRAAGEAVKVEHACPFAATIRTLGTPEFCHEVVHEFEVATYQTLNPAYELRPLETMLSKGDGPCRFCHVIRKEVPA